MNEDLGPVPGPADDGVPGLGLDDICDWLLESPAEHEQAVLQTQAIPEGDTFGNPSVHAEFRCIDPSHGDSCCR